MTISVANRRLVDVSADALRAYFIGLRRGRYSQEQVAQAAGMSRRAWIDYEKGRTHEIDQEIRRVSKGLPRLRDLLRSRRARVDPDDDEPDQ